MIMERQITITTGNKNVCGITNKFMGMINLATEGIRKYYSQVLERDITTRQTVMLLKAQAAFFTTIMPADYPLMLRAVACAWFILTLRNCKKEL